MSFAIFPTYPPPGIQSPDRTGLPSAVFGTGAERFGFPSGVRGMPAVGYFTHCAAASAVMRNDATMIGRAFMAILLFCSVLYCYTKKNCTNYFVKAAPE